MTARRQLPILDTTMTTESRQRRRRRPRQQRSSSLPYILTTAAMATLLPTAKSSADSSYSLFSDRQQFPGTTRIGNDRDVTTKDGTLTFYSTCPDLEYIIGPMNEADANNDGFLSKEEYVEFTNAVSGGYLTELGKDESFTDMPLSLQESYLVLSCVCGLFPNQEWGREGCCETDNPDGSGIRTVGTDPGEVPTKQELSYLAYVCGTMSFYLENAGAELVAPPTQAPTDMPTKMPTPEPTDVPTKRPTSEPTKSPTEMPTSEPTKKPTSEPTKNPVTLPPTEEPTKKPTPEPTSEPSKRPTKSPTPPPVEPGEPTQSPVTKSPTKTPTPEPTSEPSKRPTPSPTKAPAPEPTPEPSTKPTPMPTVEEGFPTPAPVDGTSPSKQPTPKPDGTSPTTSPTEPAPSKNPSKSPTLAPTDSVAPTMAPSVSSSPSAFIYTGDVPAVVDFIASLNGVTAEEVMAGETNQVKVMLEEQLLVLSEIVIEEEFRGNGTDDGDSSTRSTRESPASADNLPSDEPLLRRRRRARERRFLIVKEATLARVDSVQDVVCPSGTYVGITSETTLPTECLHFNNTILLSMIDEPNVEEQVEIFESAMIAKIADGWLVDNFDLEEALKPPPTPGPTPSKDVGEGNKGEGTDTLEPQPLSVGAIIGIVFGVLACFLLTMLFAGRNNYRNKNTPPPDDDYDLERQQSIKDSDAEVQDDMGLDPRPVFDDEASLATADRSYNSQEPLLSSQDYSSTAMSHSMSPMPLMREMPSDDDSDIGESIYSASAEDDMDHIGDINASSSSLAAMSTASMLVASHTPPSTGEMSPSSPDSSQYSVTGGVPADDDFSIEEEYNAAAMGVTAGAMGARAAAQAAPASQSWAEQNREAAAFGGGGGAPPTTAAAAEEGGLSAGAAAAIGAGGAGLVAVGAYAATRPPEQDSKSSVTSTPSAMDASAMDASTPSPLDDLDNAIESGNWGHVGALAAVLAFQGHGSHKSSSRSPGVISASRSDDSSNRSGSTRSSSMVGASLDQTRAVEIDKLVENGDWQAVVLAAARFEADQTFDGESSFSASGTSQSSMSRSSRWTGSATSATTPRSMATTEQSASNMSSQRGQAEIRAEVEALVRRVVPEEADNIDEMMTQFKGREEELVETLRRMQERAIASRARLAVQKSAKLEAKAKASPKRGTSGASGMASGQSVASASSTKSELEQAIEAGNWQAVGAAAQRMSDQSVGELSVDEKARLRDAISQSPAFNRHRPSRSPAEDFNLDALIEQGDWTGVIAAAKSASEDRPPEQHGQQGTSMMDEENAMAQANMWQEIADQSKQEAGQGPAGAGDAAAWAIQRSLRALDTSGETGETGNTKRTIADIADDSGDSHYESSSFDDSAGRSLDEYMQSGI
mmetsp:Transcript_34080/g.59899  ORF Transcript_34080/g.59899 Transcript_34080/m.59899 type:complete len:1382 (+) Transcript_34080:155-4300(+)